MAAALVGVDVKFKPELGKNDGTASQATSSSQVAEPSADNAINLGNAPKVKEQALLYQDVFEPESLKALKRVGATIEERIGPLYDKFYRLPAIDKIAHALDGEIGEKLDRIVDTIAHGAQCVGEGVESAANVLEASGEKVEETSEKLEQRLHALSDELRDLARNLDTRASSETGGAAEYHQSCAVALRETASEIRAKSNDPAFQRALLHTGQVALLIASDAVELTGKLVALGGRAVRFALALVGKVFRKTVEVGREVLSSFAIEFGTGIRMGFGFNLFRTGAGAMIYFPSVKEAKAAGSFAKKVVVDHDIAAATPVVAYNRTNRGKVGVSINLYFFRAAVDAISECMAVGWPGKFMLTLGRDTVRGPFISYSLSFGPNNPGVSALWQVDTTAYSPFFSVLSEKGVRPVALAFSQVLRAGEGAVRWVGEQLGLVKPKEAQRETS